MDSDYVLLLQSPQCRGSSDDASHLPSTYHVLQIFRHKQSISRYMATKHHRAGASAPKMESAFGACSKCQNAGPAFHSKFASFHSLDKRYCAGPLLPWMKKESCSKAEKACAATSCWLLQAAQAKGTP